MTDTTVLDQEAALRREYVRHGQLIAARPANEIRLAELAKDIDVLLEQERRRTAEIAAKRAEQKDLTEKVGSAYEDAVARRRQLRRHRPDLFGGTEDQPQPSQEDSK